MNKIDKSNFYFLVATISVIAFSGLYYFSYLTINGNNKKVVNQIVKSVKGISYYKVIDTYENNIAEKYSTSILDSIEILHFVPNTFLQNKVQDIYLVWQEENRLFIYETQFLGSFRDLYLVKFDDFYILVNKNSFIIRDRVLSLTYGFKGISSTYDLTALFIFLLIILVYLYLIFRINTHLG
ncbi:MAG: hypothetical protein IH620_02750, partial [Ignavibacterium sp.]|nr:hypothetical protein [Ignavibacterium sp.]